MKRCLPGLMLLSMVACFSGCELAADNRILAAHLVDHFRQNGFEGRFRRVKPDVIGAEQAGRYVRAGKFDVEFAKFDDARKAKKLAQTGFRGLNVYAHGKYIMLVRNAESEEELVRVFRKF